MKIVSFYQLPVRQLRSMLRPWVIGGTIVLSALLALAPPPAGLSDTGMRALALFFICVIFWTTNAIPLMITSLMAIVLLPLLGIIDSPQAYSLFGNQAVFFILGAFILASGLMRSGLSTRIALKLLERFDHSPKKLLLGLLLLPAILSCVMSEHAVAAMFFPIVVSLTAAITSPGSDRYKGSLFMAMAWGAIIGGIVTFLGGARAVLAIGILEETTGTTVGFGAWALASAPIAIIMLLVAACLLLWRVRHSEPDIRAAVQELNAEVNQLGPVSRREWGFAAIMCITIGLWVFFGHQLGLANIAVMAVVVAFIFKLLSWSEVQTDVNWGIILMYGGAIGLGVALSDSGATDWFLQLVLEHTTVSAVAIIFILAVVALFLTEVISNSAVVALLLPVAIAFAIDAGIDPAVATLLIAIPSGLAFMLPMSTPATAIALSSRYLTVGYTIRTGIILNLVAAVLIVVVARFYWPLLGLSLY